MATHPVPTVGNTGRECTAGQQAGPMGTLAGLKVRRRAAGRLWQRRESHPGRNERVQCLQCGRSAVSVTAATA
jgi:hypothetical protein